MFLFADTPIWLARLHVLPMSQEVYPFSVCGLPMHEKEKCVVPFGLKHLYLLKKIFWDDAFRCIPEEYSMEC
uniref:Uncharacterized protein n=1 Tax=Rhizophora mucronata TaxID=61149 RepID=A0A2P2QPX7_RHIMU